MSIDLSIDVKEVCKIIKDFIKTYVNGSKRSNVVIGLSGGVDSAVTAILCKQALGKNMVNCLFLPDETTPKIDFEHQKLIVKKFDLKCREINIDPLIKQIPKYCAVKPDRYALGNIKARIRMIILFEYANMKSSLVCGTSNKSEILVGYFTKYGDGGADILPIGDLYKTQVYQLARYLKIPEEIISKPPTAGLWRDQTDEEELKISYKKLDEVLYCLERGFDLDYIAREVNVDKKTVRRVKDMLLNSEHKRRIAVIPKLSTKTPTIDWRLPIQAK